MEARVETSKNGAGKHELTEKAPWTDEQGVLQSCCSTAAVVLDVLLTLLRMLHAWAMAAYRVFVPPPLKDVSREVVLITGTGHGMGREMALRFAELGSTVVCVDINPAGNQETLDMLPNKKKAFKYECDVTDREAVLALAARVRREVGDVTMLVNNAGIMPCKPLLQHSEKEIRTIFDVNVLAHLWLLQAFLPSMMEKNHGHVCAMSSMAGVVGLRNLVPYCGSKHAVRGLMEALHEELREDPSADYSGIKFTTICPYIVDTGLCQKPRIKFPRLMRIVSPGAAAAAVLDAVRRDYYEISIPGSLIYLNHWLRTVPRAVTLHFKDFLDSGVEAHT